MFSKKCNSKKAKNTLILNKIIKNEKAFYKYYILCKKTQALRHESNSYLK
ncbi:hypothetical protein HMPREF9406_3504 [Clostridium sp. HGF2]|nr:hypothetical protein HMPREF9406_3504 [Clostridium sp. HGF2]EQJ62656.1 hypothetical protein QSI_0791 [Clostridioides difficile P28]